jgi:predicted nucleic acid-binding Zn finger protein
MTTNTTISPIAQIEALYNRLEKAKDLFAQGKVHPVVGVADHYIVEGSQGYYLVNGSCNCPDSTNRHDLTRGYCKHRLAVEPYKEASLAKTSAVAPEHDEELARKVADLYH